MKDRHIVDQQIWSQQINLEDQHIKSGKRKSSSTSDPQISKKAKHGLDVIEERRRLRET